MSSLVRSCMELRNIFLRGWGTLKTAAVYHARLRMAHFVVQRIACGPLIAAALTYHAEVRCSTAVGQGTILRHVGAAAGKEVQANRLRNLFVPRLQSDKRKSKNRWFLAAFLHPFAAEGKRMPRRSAKYSRRRQTCRTRVQPAIEERKTGRRDASPCGVRDRRCEKRPAPGARNTFFTSYHKSAKDCNARSAFPAAGHCI